MLALSSILWEMCEMEFRWKLTLLFKQAMQPDSFLVLESVLVISGSFEILLPARLVLVALLGALLRFVKL